MTIKAILFDIDGTLVDSNDHHVAAWDEAFRAEGFTFDRQVIHDQIGKGADMLIPSLLPDADEGLRSRLADKHGEVYQTRFLPEVRPFAGARALLARVRDSGRKVVLASSASASDLDHYLHLLDATSLVTATTSAGDVEKTKPAPDIFATALERISPVAPDEALVIGDTPYDVEAAAKCGIGTIALRSGGFRDDALCRAGAIRIYDDVAELLADFDNSPLGG